MSLKRAGSGLLAVALSPLPAHAQATRPIDSFWVADAQVYALAEANGVVYAGGEFQTVGPYTGGFAVSDAATGVVDLSMPKVDGSLSVIASDGAGGWYLGGTFTRVGGVPRNNLAHVLSDGRVSAWNPSPDGSVGAIVKDSATVYLGGSFANVAGTPRSRAAAVDAATGALLPWNPNVTGASSSVSALAVGSSYVYIGGRFTAIGATGRTGLGRVDLVNGTVDTTWNPALTGFAAYTLVLSASGNEIFVGGDFTAIGGQSRRHLAQLSTSGTGLATAWNPNPDLNVNELALSATGTLLYVGGFYSNIGNGTPAARNGLAAVSATGLGAVDLTFNPNLGSLGVFGVAFRGGIVYACGSFTAVDGQARLRVAAVDATTGAVTAWDTGVNASCFTISPGATAVAIGGSFWSAGVLPRSRLAAFDAATGAATAWNPGANSRAKALAVATAGIPGDEVIYAGGQFTSVGGQTRNRIAAIDAAGAVTAWDPNANNFEVSALEVSGSSVVAAGDFTSIGGAPRSYIASLDTSTGLSQWGLAANNYVRAVSLLGTSVYAGGDFTSIGGLARTRLGKLDLATGAADATWNPGASGTAFPAVGSLLATSSVVYAGGRFTTIGGATRSAFAALAPGGTGASTPWDPLPAGGTQPEPVGGPILVHGSDVILSGDFYWLGGLGVAARQWLGSVAASNAAPTPWYVAPNNDVWDMAIGGKRLFVGGEFDSISAEPRKYLAAFCLEPMPTSLVLSGTGDNFVDLAWSGSAVGYNVYRSRAAGGPYQLVGSTTGTTFSDTSVEGGVLYYYVVRAVDGCESDASNEVSATPTGFCSLPPDFEGASWAAPQGLSCWVRIGWAAASSACGGGVSYDVYRDTSPAFSPSGANRIAAAITGTTYEDRASLSAGTVYYYIVRATGTTTGEQDGNLIRLAFSRTSCTTWPSPVAHMGVTSSAGQNVIQWMNPVSGPYTTTRIRYNAVPGSSSCTFPANATDGTLLIEKPDGGIGGRDSYAHAPLPNDNTTYCYAAFVIGGGLGSAPRTAKGRPFDTPSSVLWAYSTGASAVAAPGVGSSLFAVSNDRVVHGVARGATGGTWPPVPWVPFSLGGPAQERPPAIPGLPEIVLLGAQDGYAYAMSGATGAELWKSAVRLGDIVQAAPAAILAAYGGLYDYVLVGSRNSASNNVFYALNKDTGTVAAAFDNGGGTAGIGIISGMASVDTPSRRVFFASRARAGGSNHTLWCLQIGSGTLTKVWSAPVGDVDGSVVVRAGVVYVGNNAGQIHAVSAADGTPMWGSPLAVGAAVKGFLFPNRGTSDLYFSTFDKVWRIRDDGASGTVVWSHELAPGVTPSIPLLVAATNYLYVGGSDGQLWELELSQIPPLGKRSVMLGDGTGVVGAPSYDNVNLLVYVGSDAGIYYAVTSPF